MSKHWSFFREKAAKSLNQKGFAYGARLLQEVGSKKLAKTVTKTICREGYFVGNEEKHKKVLIRGGKWSGMNKNAEKWISETIKFVLYKKCQKPL